MGDDLSLPERECARTAMQWSTEPHGGFTTAERPLVPVIEDGPYSYEHANVAAQRRDPDSLLNWMERMIRMRKEVPEVGWGDFQVLPHDNPAILLLRYQWRNNAVLFVHNLKDDPCELRFPAQDSHGRRGVLTNLLAEDHSHAGNDDEHCILLEPYGYRWFRVGGLDYLLRRTAV